MSVNNIDMAPKLHPLPSRPRQNLGLPLLAACIYLLVLQPLHLFVIPLVTYNEYQLPGHESTYLLYASLDAWRNCFITLFGICAGIQLWRFRQAALGTLHAFFLTILISSVVLVLLPFVAPTDSYLRKTILIEQAVLFFQTLVVFLIWCGYLLSSKTSPHPINFNAHRFAVSGVAVITLIGTTFSVMAFFAPPRDIFQAAWEGNSQVVAALVNKGVDVNALNKSHNSPLHFARTTDIAEVLLSKKSNLESTYLLQRTDIRNPSNLLARLAAPSDSVSRHLWTRFSESLRQALLQPMPPMSPQAALREELMLDELNRIIREAPIAAPLSIGNAASAQSLSVPDLPPGAIQTIRFNRLVLEEAFPTDIAKSQIDWRNDMLETPLHLAAYNGRPEVASFLIKYGADVNSLAKKLGPNFPGWTPLDYACFAKANDRRGHFDAVIQLLEQNGGTNTFQVRIKDLAFKSQYQFPCF